ncbi:TetR family transcriptional regulator [Tamaricihabitans halophyticus]|uniref:TetR family transcriptional regulator n=1 Tax=Tamaricihabitans halophyticus TaxID=1262583 RepID=A0A4R2QGW8_9PSEU|nr:TetR family transcriptional regulator [Tamaricihabitans halophyticus]TCP47949.1 TetR family transcriptional regulator [Tamaricihabitans halophyticus]
MTPVNGPRVDARDDAADDESSYEEAGTGKRRGRRPGREDTRAALLTAARELFSEQGYEGATVRAIATRAGVDPAMVNHWFGGKEGLFAKAVLELPFNPPEVLETILNGGPIDTLGERIVRTFVTRWDESGGGVFTALVRSISAREDAAKALRELIMKYLLGRIASELASDHAELRASLCASQMVGLGMIRYVAAFEPLASADIPTVVALVAPNLQHYLTGELNLERAE